MGDLRIGHRLDTGRSIWTTPELGESNAPKSRIIHQRVLRLPGLARLDRVGVGPALGFHKCASSMDLDWVVDFRLKARVKGRWRTLLEQSGMSRPRGRQLRWFDVGGVEVDGVILEVRRTGLDGWWPSWNIVTGGFVLEGELIGGLAGRRERWLTLEEVDLDHLPNGVEAEHIDGTVRYRTEEFEVGFRLDRPGMSFLGLGSEDRSLRAKNLLLTNPVKCDQGLQLHPVGQPAIVAPAIRCELEGTVSVHGAKIAYDLKAGNQRYSLRWTVTARGLELAVERSAEKSERFWHSSAWTLGWNNAVSPTHAVGEMITRGETGALRPPLWINAPGFGTWLIESDDEHARVRSESRRLEDLHQVELKVGEIAERDGLHRLPRGRFAATFRLRPVRPPRSLRRTAPAVVQRAWERTYFVAPTFRADIGTLANSGASMTCPICMDTWAAVLPKLGLEQTIPGSASGDGLLALSIERWLAGGPGYAAGKLSHDGKVHDADDEYLMTGAAILRGIGDYLNGAATSAWFRRHRPAICDKIIAARGRDLDDDGLIESPYRTGTSGSGQWSTCWLDVTSFGWKCAWSNAILFGALRELAAGFTRFGDLAMATELGDWGAKLKAHYRDTFWHDKSGWLAGWRCADDQLHDHAFLPVNGTAVREGLLDAGEARAVMERLLAEVRRVRLPDPALGLPMNLWPIPDADRADILQGYPFGYYQNGGRTHSQTRHFVMALYAVGLRTEADELLERLCVGFAEAATFGGNRTGVDWRTWEDTPCGYEGLLTDQFGLLEAIHWRWAQKSR